MIRIWLISILAVAAVAGAQTPEVVATFTTGADQDYGVIRFQGHAFPYLIQDGLPVLVAVESIAAPASDRVRCTTPRGSAWITWEALAKHLAEQAWPARRGPSAFMGRLTDESGRWELLVADDAEGGTGRRAIPLHGFPAATMKAGNVLIIGTLDDTLITADQRNEAYLIVESWIAF